jgi:amidase
VAAVEQVASVLRALGHSVQAMRLQAPTGVALAVFAHWFAAAALDADALVEPARMLPATRRHVAIGRLVTRLKLVRPGARERWRERFEAMLADSDLLLTPTTASTAIAADGWMQKGWGAHVRSALAFAPFTGAANFAGLPAISVPAGMHEGLPVGAQFVGRAGSEALLLAIAQEIERERPWPRHALALRE